MQKKRNEGFTILEKRVIIESSSVFVAIIIINPFAWKLPKSKGIANITNIIS